MLIGLNHGSFGCRGEVAGQFSGDFVGLDRSAALRAAPTGASLVQTKEAWTAAGTQNQR